MRDELHAQLAPYRARHLDVRWTRPETWHLTLLFLGSVEHARVTEVEALMAQVAQQGAPYRARVERGGGRVGRGDGVAWIGLSVGSGQLIETAQQAAAACPPDISDGPAPRRTPSAHLTVVRRADRSVIEALRTQAHGELGVEWTVDRVALVRSHLEPSGASYQTLAEVAL